MAEYLAKYRTFIPDTCGGEGCGGKEEVGVPLGYNFIADDDSMALEMAKDQHPIMQQQASKIFPKAKNLESKLDSLQRVVSVQYADVPLNSETGSDVYAQVERRKKEALNKRIEEKARVILHHLGKSYFHDMVNSRIHEYKVDDLHIETSSGEYNHLDITHNNTQVFKVQSQEGKFEIVKYLPGLWEDNVEKAYQEAMKRNHSKLKESEAELRTRFGI